MAASRLGAGPTVSLLANPAGTQTAQIAGLTRAILPDGRIVTPHGAQLQVGLEPLGSALSPNGKTLVLTDSGNDGGGGPTNSLEVIDTQSLTVTYRLQEPGFFVGAAFSPNGKTVYTSVASDSRSSSADSIVAHTLGDISGTRNITTTLQPGDFPAGLSIGPGGRTLYVAALGNHIPGTGNVLYTIDTATARVVRRTGVGNYPYQAQIARDGNTVYVSNWGTFRYSLLDKPQQIAPFADPSGAGNTPLYGSSVWALDAHTGQIRAQIPVGPARGSKNPALPGGQVVNGSHPSAMALSKDGAILYVATTTDDSIAQISTRTNKVLGYISVAPYAGAPKGTYPNALAVAPDGSRLFAAEAGINAVAVIDTASARVLGHIPVGFYPTSITVSPDGKTIYVVNGKGLGAGPNGKPVLPSNPKLVPASPSTYVQNIQFATLSAITLANEDLSSDTRQVLANNGYVPTRIAVPAGNPVPTALGQGSPIKHVIFITKENRTWDQVMGDYPRGNNDPSLVLYGQNITPNQHAFADRFATDDNFYADAQASGEGHIWLQAANSTDFADKTQVMGYSGRMGGYVHNYEVENYPQAGSIYNDLASHGLDYRIYGEGIRTLGFSPNYKIADPLDYTSPTTNTYVLLGVNAPPIPGVAGHIDPTFPSYNLKITDTRRAREFIREYNQFEAAGNLPSFSYIWLPNDHAAGASTGFPSPGTQVADNDQAVGMIVDAVSHSPDWKNTAIFITEDDAQDGQDHVDAYRTIDYVISPWVKPGYMSHVHYDTVSMLRTMELILGIPPMSQYDAAATPMYDLFDNQIHLNSSVYAMKPLVYKPIINNGASRFAALSNRLQLDRLDRNPGVSQAILWAMAKGEQAPTSAR